MIQKVASIGLRFCADVSIDGYRICLRDTRRKPGKTGKEEENRMYGNTRGGQDVGTLWRGTE